MEQLKNLTMYTTNDQNPYHNRIPVNTNTASNTSIIGGFNNTLTSTQSNLIAGTINTNPRIGPISSYEYIAFDVGNSEKKKQNLNSLVKNIVNAINPPQVKFQHAAHNSDGLIMMDRSIIGGLIPSLQENENNCECRNGDCVPCK